MQKQPGKAAKIRCSAAQCRALIPFGLELNLLLSSVSPVEEAAKVGMIHLHQCYMALSNIKMFAGGILKASATKFA